MGVARLKLLSFILIVLLTNTLEAKESLFGQNNAIWAQSLFFRGHKPSSGRKLVDADIVKFAGNLKRNRVPYAYIFSGPYQKDGSLPAFAFSDTAKNSLAKIRKLYRQVVILPWIGGVQDSTVFLNKPEWRKRAVASTVRFVKKMGLKGVHVDLEQILQNQRSVKFKPTSKADFDKYGQNVNEFHKQLRKALPNSFISSTVLATSPQTKPWKKKTPLRELKELVKHVDQLSFLFYDTSIKDQKVFAAAAKSLLEDIKSLKSTPHGKKVQYLIAMGTFKNYYKLRHFRDLKIESIPNTLMTLKHQAKLVSPKQRLIDGIAIYCEWLTAETAWHQFRTLWSRTGSTK